MGKSHGAFALALALALVFAPCARADVVIRNDPGGVIANYIEKYTAIAARGDRVVIAGGCNSACTLLLGIVPRERVCVRAGARLGFHSASYVFDGGYSASGTELMWRHYPERVRAMLRARGWNGNGPHPQVISIRASAVYRACPRQN